MSAVDAVVIGAGQAGLAVSYLLRRSGIDHVVFERGRAGESWRSQRWDSFCLNTPNWSNSLPGMTLDAENPASFGNRDELVAFFDRYVGAFDLPVRSMTPVRKLERLPDDRYSVDIDGGSLEARAVVVATGSMSQPYVPAEAENLPESTVSISAGEYRNASRLPSGAVVVVGSGQSGCQIAEDLLGAGRRTYICASRVGRVPRTYRGRDILEWWRDMGFLEVRVEDLEDPSARFAAQPQVSGTRGGHTVSLQSLARDGATLLGRLTGVDGTRLRLGDDLHDSIAFADEKSLFFKNEIDAWIDSQGVDARPADPDPGEPTLPDLVGSGQVAELDLERSDVGSVIWCTGFGADWSWAMVDAFDDDGHPRHERGVTDLPGLYFIGFPWLSKRKSGILYGIPEDAARVVSHLERHLSARTRS